MGMGDMGLQEQGKGGCGLTYHQAIYKSTDVVQVNIPAESGDMGILANHVPSIEQLRPGLIEVFEESGGSKQFFRRCTYARLDCPV